MRDALPEFQAAMRARGLEPPAEIVPGKLHRFPANGKRGDDAGWCKLFEDGRGGVFGDHRSGLSESWQSERDRPYTPAEREAYIRQCEEAKREREADEVKRHAEAAAQATDTWKASEPAPEDHPYLKRKGVKPHGIRQVCGRLVIPARDGRELHSLQFIDAQGEKRYLPAGRKAGCYHAIGQPERVLCIVEGYATGATIHEATGLAVAVAFDAGNLLPVALALRARYPDLVLVLCADDDAATDGNPGIAKATAAAAVTGGYLAVPDFGEDRPAWVSDFNDLAAHHGPAAVRACIEARKRVEPPQSASEGAPLPSPSVALAGAPITHSDAREWPGDLPEAALIGLAGDIVRAIRPITEADDAAILIQTLTAFGALAGRFQYVQIEGDRHYPQLFGLVVGDTSNARKGTSWGRVRELFSGVPKWPRIVEGLSSGEGFKWQVRDEIRKAGPNGIEEVADEGVHDKRLLVVESEFAQVLRQGARAGNTLSPTIRAAWDTGNLATLTRNDPITATGSHVCIVGHITAEELRAELTATDSANGFANRFIFMCAKRSKLLPRGGGAFPAEELARLRERIVRASNRAGLAREIEMTAEAWESWERVYPTLTAGMGGLLGAVTARAAPQCRRLALIYALMDESSEIEARHVLAALAVWERAEASAKWIFGSTLGDRVADELLRAIRAAGAGGMTRTDIRDLFKKHAPAERIGVALDLLASKGLAARAEVKPGAGRTPEVWRAS